MSKTSAIQRLVHKSGLYIRKYSPATLSCIASIGVVATTVMAVKATPKALDLIRADSRKNHDGDPNAYSKKEAVISAWKCYIPAAALGFSTIACIMGANMFNRRQQAAMASAYALIQNSYKEYKDMGIVYRLFLVGTLRVDRSDPDGPFIFLELKNPVGHVTSKKYVVLKVEDKDFIPRE